MAAWAQGSLLRCPFSYLGGLLPQSNHAKTQGKEGQGIRRLSGAVGRVDDVKYISPSYPLLLNLYLVILEKTWENVLMVRKDKLQQEKCMSGNSAQTLQCLCFHEVLLNTSQKIIGSFA